MWNYLGEMGMDALGRGLSSWDESITCPGIRWGFFLSFGLHPLLFLHQRKSRGSRFPGNVVAPRSQLTPHCNEAAMQRRGAVLAVKLGRTGKR